jgi:hypothetical protein
VRVFHRGVAGICRGPLRAAARLTMHTETTLSLDEVHRCMELFAPCHRPSGRTCNGALQRNRRHQPWAVRKGYTVRYCMFGVGGLPLCMASSHILLGTYCTVVS